MNRLIEGAKLGMLVGALAGWLFAVATGYGKIESLLIQILYAGIGGMLGCVIGVWVTHARRRG